MSFTCIQAQKFKLAKEKHFEVVMHLTFIFVNAFIFLIYPGNTENAVFFEDVLFWSTLRCYVYDFLLDYPLYVRN